MLEVEKGMSLYLSRDNFWSLCISLSLMDGNVIKSKRQVVKLSISYLPNPIKRHNNMSTVNIECFCIYSSMKQNCLEAFPFMGVLLVWCTIYINNKYLLHNTATWWTNSVLGIRETWYLRWHLTPPSGIDRIEKMFSHFKITVLWCFNNIIFFFFLCIIFAH